MNDGKHILMFQVQQFRKTRMTIIAQKVKGNYSSCRRATGAGGPNATVVPAFVVHTHTHTHTRARTCWHTRTRIVVLVSSCRRATGAGGPNATVVPVLWYTHTRAHTTLHIFTVLCAWRMKLVVPTAQRDVAINQKLPHAGPIQVVPRRNWHIQPPCIDLTRIYIYI